MKFKVHVFDFKRTNGGARIGRFEIYNEDGEFIDGSGKRRVRNYEPAQESLPISIIQNIVGKDKTLVIKSTTTQTDVRPRRPSPLTMYYNQLGLNPPVNHEISTIYEVSCGE